LGDWFLNALATSPARSPITLATLMSGWLRQVLLGPEDGWGARMATGQSAIYLLACLAMLTNMLDLATGLNMMLTHGIHLEQNPLARAIMHSSGPLGLVQAKLAVVLLGVLVFVWTARVGRARLARNCLVFALGVGMLGAASNMI
jgi:hypothetical protein